MITRNHGGDGRELAHGCMRERLGVCMRVCAAYALCVCERGGGGGARDRKPAAHGQSPNSCRGAHALPWRLVVLCHNADIQVMLRSRLSCMGCELSQGRHHLRHYRRHCSSPRSTAPQAALQQRDAQVPQRCDSDDIAHRMCKAVHTACDDKLVLSILSML